MSRDLAEEGEEERRGYEKRTKEEEGKQKLRLRQTSYEMKRDVEESTSRKICEAVQRERERELHFHFAHSRRFCPYDLC